LLTLINFYFIGYINKTIPLIIKYLSMNTQSSAYRSISIDKITLSTGHHYQESEKMWNKIGSPPPALQRRCIKIFISSIICNTPMFFWSIDKNPIAN